MNELLLGTSRKPMKIYTGANPIDKYTTLPRTMAACCLYGNQIFVYGGIAGLPNQYPQYGFKINLNTKQTLQIAGYYGTWSNGAVVGNKIYVTYGHDGSYRNYVYVFNPTTGAHETTIFTNKAERVRAAIVPASDGSGFYYGLGIDGAGYLRDFYFYNIAQNKWTTLAPMPLEHNVAFGNNAVMGADGKIHVMFGDYFPVVYSYDPVTNTWARGASYDIDEGGAVINWGDSIAAGKYVIRVTSSLPSEEVDCMKIIRYDTQLKEFSVIKFPEISSRFNALAAVSDDKTKLYVISGFAPIVSNTPVNDRTRNNEILTFNMSDILIE